MIAAPHRGGDLSSRAGPRRPPVGWVGPATFGSPRDDDRQPALPALHCRVDIVAADVADDRSVTSRASVRMRKRGFLSHPSRSASPVGGARTTPRCRSWSTPLRGWRATARASGGPPGCCRRGGSDPPARQLSGRPAPLSHPVFMMWVWSCDGSRHRDPDTAERRSGDRSVATRRWVDPAAGRRGDAGGATERFGAVGSGDFAPSRRTRRSLVTTWVSPRRDESEKRGERVMCTIAGRRAASGERVLLSDAGVPERHRFVPQRSRRKPPQVLIESATRWICCALASS